MTSAELDVPLTDSDRELLARGLNEWGGPAFPSEELAVALGFAGLDDMRVQTKRLIDALRARQPLSRADWTRVLVSVELVFISDTVGSGRDWETTTGFTDVETLTALRRLQREIPTGPQRSAAGLVRTSTPSYVYSTVHSQAPRGSSTTAGVQPRRLNGARCVASYRQRD